ncbi:EAL domain-containing protein [Sphingomonas sp. HHU CXW]|uniref:EAL domain-containing protein n=2 Tax=Sphingomonas hominis TaxID=2741495 RepID=A0ABX2JQ17_9SPHN|nr:EAL domain-containing protein [Sphingomonas hominis]
MLVAAQFDSLRDQVPNLHLILLVNVTFLAFITAVGHYSSLTFLPSLLLAAGSMSRVIKWRRMSYPGVAATRLLFRSTIRTSILFGLILAGWSIWVMARSDQDAAPFIPFFAALSTIACAACLVSLPAAAYAVIWSGTVPMVLAMLASRDTAMMAAAVNLSVIATLIFGWMRRQHLQFRGIVRAHADTIDKEREVATFAFCDQLTGLANRRAFMSGLLASQRPEGEPLNVAVVLIDLDDFKLVNDKLGHAVGDALLCGIAARLQHFAPPDATCARLGGDEFAILLPGVDQAATEAAVRDIARVFDAPLVIDEAELDVFGSIGISAGDRWPDDAMVLMRRADLALYESKRNKRHAPFFFRDELQMRSDRRRVIETSYLDPVALDTLDVVFQPIVRVATGKVMGCEALARWVHPQLGRIPPDELFDVADRARVAHHFTRHLLRRALQKARHWPDTIVLSFNVTAGEVGDALQPMIAELCAAHDFSPSRLMIEITETALMRDLALAQRTIDDLRAMGIRVALDDFGAGFASIAYLKSIRFDLIKIDGGLVTAIAESALARQLLAGVVQLCRAIGTPIVVEQVETEAQLTIVSLLGVEKVQGYLVGRPVSDPAFTAFVAADRPAVPPPPPVLATAGGGATVVNIGWPSPIGG